MATRKTITAAPKDQVALTVKVSPTVYKRLSALRADTRTTTQDILNAALEAHLRKAGV